MLERTILKVSFMCFLPSADGENAEETTTGTFSPPALSSSKRRRKSTLPKRFSQIKGRESHRSSSCPPPLKGPFIDSGDGRSSVPNIRGHREVDANVDLPSNAVEKKLSRSHTEAASTAQEQEGEMREMGENMSAEVLQDDIQANVQAQVLNESSPSEEEDVDLVIVSVTEPGKVRFLNEFVLVNFELAKGFGCCSLRAMTSFADLFFC